MSDESLKPCTRVADLGGEWVNEIICDLKLQILNNRKHYESCKPDGIFGQQIKRVLDLREKMLAAALSDSAPADVATVRDASKIFKDVMQHYSIGANGLHVFDLPQDLFDEVEAYAKGQNQNSGTGAQPQHPPCHVTECADAVFDDWPDYNSQALGCGLEDRGITDRYEAMQYGWDQCMERVGERIEQFCADLPQFASEVTECGTTGAESWFYSTIANTKVGPFPTRDKAWQHFKGADINRIALLRSDSELLNIYQEAAPAAQHMAHNDLVKALRPFAAFACSPFGQCKCNNCYARDVLEKANQPAVKEQGQ